MARTRRRGAFLALLTSALVAVPAAAASAHPFGPPQTLEISRGAEDTVATVRWHPGALDDYTYAGVHLGIVKQDRSREKGGILYSKQDADVLASSAAFADYVRRDIRMTSDGQDCAGALDTIGNLVADGVRITFRCPGPISAAQLKVTMLTDLHPAYRTLATGPDGQRFVYSSSESTHGWSLTSDGSGQHLAVSALLQISSVVLGMAAVAGGLVWVRRRTRRIQTA